MAGTQTPAVGFVADVYFNASVDDVAWDGDDCVVQDAAVSEYARRLDRLAELAEELGITFDVDWTEAEVNCDRGTWDGVFGGAD